MEGKRNLCAQIPISLHNRVREEQERRQETLSEYVQHVLTQYYEYEKKGGAAMGKGSKTLAFQVTEEFFQRVKAYLDKHPKLTQREFVLGLIEQELERFEAGEEPDKDEMEPENSVYETEESDN